MPDSRTPFGLVTTCERAPKILYEDLVVSSQVVAPADDHDVDIRPPRGPGCRRHAAAVLSRRLMRLRSVVCPTFLVTVRPRRRPRSVPFAQPHPGPSSAPYESGGPRPPRQSPDVSSGARFFLWASAGTAQPALRPIRLRRSRPPARRAAMTLSAAPSSRCAPESRGGACARSSPGSDAPLHGSSLVGSRGSGAARRRRPSGLNGVSPETVSKKRSAPQKSAVSLRAYDGTDGQSQRRSGLYAAIGPAPVVL